MSRVTFADLPDRRDVARGIRVRVPVGVVRCPECDGPLSVEEQIETWHPSSGVRRTLPRVAMCGCCEFTHPF